MRPIYENQVIEACKLFRDSVRDWALELEHGFNILLSGHGSKKCLLDLLMDDWLQHYPIIELKGYVSDVSVSECLAMILERVIGMKKAQNLHLCKLALQITKKLSQKKKFVFVVHSMDALPLRNDETQEALSILASSQFVLMIASVDQKGFRLRTLVSNPQAHSCSLGQVH